MNIVIAHDFNDFARCIMIRTRVFVIEQNICAEIETDKWENSSTHYLATDGEKALATARWRLIDNQAAKIERVAVLKEARGQGVGTALMRYLLQEIHSQPNIQTIKLGSQNSAIPFYEKLGFQVIGKEYLDAGIPHHLMVKNNSDV
ncbi:MAG: GNAT family N-acetyltransferase [Cyanobacteria bacterium]|jgi:predicted GNAT family N-acyltransferase|nr:GNAT family N-acetyltransferase [Cyanobacteria bacterium GSL.Bin1]